MDFIFYHNFIQGQTKYFFSIATPQTNNITLQTVVNKTQAELIPSEAYIHCV